MTKAEYYARRGKAKGVESTAEGLSIPNAEMANPVGQNDVVMFDDRESIYAEHLKASYPESAPVEAETEPQKAETSPSEPEIEKEVKSESAPVEAETVETPKEDKGYTPVLDKSKEDKFVPYGALKEEREKRKELQKRLDEISQYESAEEHIPKSDDDFITRKDIKDLEGYIRGQAEREITLRRESNIRQTNDVLEKEGVYGFSSVGRHLVLSKLVEISQQDPGYAQALDNPEGWAQIYKTEYPSLKKMFVEQERDKNLKDKELLKKTAGLVTTPGKIPESHKEEKKELSYEETKKNYGDMRNKSLMY